MRTNESVPNLSVEVYQALKKKIIKFDLMPGQLLIVQQLSSEMGISRTPVREAMVRLLEEGFLVEVAGRKFKVSGISWGFISDLYHARMILESYAIKNTNVRELGELIPALRTNIGQLEKSLMKHDSEAIFVADSEFHRIIISNCRNDVIISWLDRLNDHQMRIRFLTASMEDRLSATLVEHSAVVECLERGDLNAADEKMNAHLLNMLEKLQEQQNTRPSLINLVVKESTTNFWDK